MRYYSRFTPKKRINARSIRMAQITVYDLKDKVIGSYAWSHLIPRFKEQEIKEKVTMLIREYELSKGV